MKRFIVIGLVTFMISCNADDPEVINKKIIQQKEQISRINKKIKKLEDILRKNSTNESSKHLIPVKVKEAKYETFKHFIEVLGSIEAIEDANISPEIGGQINKIHIHEGQRINKGQLLVTLKTEVTKSAIQEVKTGLDLAKKLYDKQKSLWDQKIGSEMQFLEAKNAYEQSEARLKTLQAQLEMSNIKAPFTGIVDEIFQKEGELAAPGFRILQLVNLSKLKIIAKVSEVYLPSIYKGKKIDVLIPSYPDDVLRASVFRTGNVVNPANRTFKVEVRLDNKNEKYKPNMLALLRINDLTIEEAIKVPSNIIKKDIAKTEIGDFKEFLFISEEADSVLVAKKVFVVTGENYKNESVIVEGVELGEKIIVEGFNTVSSGTKIRIIN